MWWISEKRGEERIGYQHTALHGLYQRNGHVEMAIGATCGRPLAEVPGAIPTRILTDILEQFGTSEAIRSWNSLEHLKLRGLK